MEKTQNGLLTLLLSNNPEPKEKTALGSISVELSDIDVKNIILSDKSLYPKSYKAILTGLKPAQSEGWYSLIGKTSQISSISLRKIKESEAIIADISGKNYSINKSVLAHFMGTNGEFVSKFMGISGMRSFDSKSKGYYIAFDLIENATQHLKRRKALKLFHVIDNETAIEVEHAKKVLSMLENLDLETEAEMQNVLKSKGIAYTSANLVDLFEEHC